MWTRDGALLLSVWFSAEEEADLATFAGGRLERLTRTPAGELLDDATDDGRVLFEREGMLVETGGGSVERVLGRGRAGRYTPDGRHILFVRGNEHEPLGVWRQGYAGGDDSEIFLLDVATGAVTRITDSPDNDECPIPLDDAGKRFLVCRERESPYRPWLVSAVSSRIHRVHRFPMPDGPWPILFPTLCRTPEDRLELWVEADGRLFHAMGTIADTGLAFAPAEPVRIELQSDAVSPAPQGAALFDEVASHLAAGELTREPWRGISEGERRRFRTELQQIMDPQARVDLLNRLLGRLALPGLCLTAEGMPAATASIAPRWVLPDAILAHALESHGIAYLTAAALPPALAAHPVLDLRGADRLPEPPDSLAAKLCARQPLILLLDGTTDGEAEILADRLAARRCARLVGRPTAGTFMITESRPLVAGGTLVLPVRKVERQSGGSGSAGVIPRFFVPSDPDPTRERWLEIILEALESA